MAISDFKEVGSQVIFTGTYMEVYIPRFYFDSAVAVQLGNKIQTLGLFNFKIFKDANKTDNPKIETFSFPSVFTTVPTTLENKEIPNLVKDVDETSYTVLKYYKDDVFIDNTLVAKSSDNTMMFINLLHGGKLPPTIPYDKVVALEMENLSINSINLRVSATVLELIVSEIYRSKSDLGRSFRFDAAAGKDMYSYKAINIKSIANFNSTFTAVTFEDLDYALVTSVVKARTNKKESISPVEKTIKY